MGALRVIVAGYGPIYRAGLCAVLPSSDHDSQVAVVGVAGDLDRSTRLAKLVRPDVVITDLSFPEGPDRSARELLDAHPATSLLLLLERSQLDAGLDGAEDLASGVVLRPAARSDLMEAMIAVTNGLRYTDQRLVSHESQEEARSAPVLTEREAEVLQLLAFGYTNAEIASHLVISIRTAESHRSNIQRKLGVRTRAELARAAWREGLSARSLARHGSPA